MKILPYILNITLISIILFFSAKASSVKDENGEIYIKRYTNASKSNLLIAYIFLIIFSVYRVIEPGFGGKDALAYKNYFHGSIGTLKDALNFQNYEYGYAFFVWVIRSITNNYEVVLFFIYTFLFVAMIKYVKRITWNKYTFFTLVLLVALIVNSFNITRVIVSVFIGMIVYTLLHRKKYFKATLLSFLAISIHISAVILLPNILIYAVIANKNRFSGRRLIGLVLLMAFFAFIGLNIIDSYILGTKYRVYSNSDGIALKTYIMISIVSMLSIFKYKEITRQNSFNKVLITLLPIGLIILPMQMQFSILYRMILYFLPIMYSLIPAVIEAYKVTSKKYIHYYPIRFGLILYMFMKIYIFFTVEVLSSGVPYMNSLFN